MTHNPPLRIESPRLVLRCWSPNDAPLCRQAVLESREHLLEWMDWAGDDHSLTAVTSRLQNFRNQFLNGEDFTYGVFDTRETTVLGGTGLHPRIGAGGLEIGYWIHINHLNQGLATELTAALVQIGFESCNARFIEIHCDPKNFPSQAVPRKLNFQHQVTIPLTITSPSSTLRDTMVWTMSTACYHDHFNQHVSLHCSNDPGH